MNIVSNAANSTHYIQHAHLPLPSPPLSPVCGDDPPSHRGTPGRLPQTHGLREAAHICGDGICEVGEKLDARRLSRMGLSSKSSGLYPLRGWNSALEHRLQVRALLLLLFLLSPLPLGCDPGTMQTLYLNYMPPLPAGPAPSGMCTSRWTACTCCSSPPRPATSWRTWRHYGSSHVWSVGEGREGGREWMGGEVVCG